MKRKSVEHTFDRNIKHERSNKSERIRKHHRSNKQQTSKLNSKSRQALPAADIKV